MRYITEGVNAINGKPVDDKMKETKKIEILEYVKPEMASTEIEAFIEDIVNEL